MFSKVHGRSSVFSDWRRLIALIVVLLTVAFATPAFGDDPTPTPTDTATAQATPSPSPQDTATPTDSPTPAPTASPVPSATPRISSDKADYAPGATVTLAGSEWQPGESVSIFVNDNVGNTWSDTIVTTADGDGSFVVSFSLPKSFVAQYKATATGSSGGSASTTFTDSLPVDFHQCQNDNDNNNIPNTCAWVGGSLNQNDSIYTEGQSVPQRVLQQLPRDGATHTLRLSYQFSKSDTYAYDFLTSPDFTVGSLLNECGTAISSTFTGSSESCSQAWTNRQNAPVPSDTFGPASPAGAKVSAHEYGNRNLYVGCDPACSGAPTVTNLIHDPATVCYKNCGDSTVFFDVTVTAPSGGGTVTMGIWFGGHVAAAVKPAGSGTAIGWGTGCPTGTLPCGASSIPGAPYHIHYECLEPTATAPGGCQGGGSQDNALQAGSVVVPATLTVAKVTSPSTGAAGPQFSFTTQNDLSGGTQANSLADTQSFTIVNLLPGTYTSTEADPSPTYSNTAIACVGDNNSSGDPATRTATFVLAAGENVTCTFTNTLAQPNLSITKTANPVGPVSAGATIGFDITVANAANAGPANNVVVTDTLPTTSGLNWTVTSIDSNPPPQVSPCSISNSVLTCNFGTMASGSSHTVHISSPTTAASCATIQNRASVSATGVTTIQTPFASVVVQCPDLRVTKTANPVGPVSAGTPIGFDIRVDNLGPGIARGVTLSDTLPTTGGTSWTIATIDGAAPPLVNPPCSISTGVLSCAFGDMASGTFHTVRVTSPTTSASCTTIQNSVVALSTNDGFTSNTATVDNHHLATASVVVNCPTVTITKTAVPVGPVDAGDSVGFLVTVSNAGPGSATGVTVTDTLPTTSGTSWTIALIDNAAPGQNPPCAILNGVLTCNFGTMAPNTSHSVKVTSPTTSASCGTIRNSASVLVSNDGVTTPSLANGHLASASVVVNCPDLRVTKTANPPGPVSAGRTIGFDIVVSNVGGGTAAGVTLSDTLPTTAGTSWSIALIDGVAPGQNPPCSISNGILSCSFGNMATNVQHSVRITSPTTFQSCSTIPNSVTALATNDGITAQTASVANNHVATASVTVQCPSVTVTKTADPVGPVDAGDTVGFVITVSNGGPGSATGVTVTDTLPTTSGTSWTIALIDNAAPGQNPPCAISNGVLTCNFGTMTPNTSHTVKVTSPTSSSSCASIQNSASVLVSNDGVTTPSVQNGHLASASVTVNCPSLSVTKTANPPGPVSAGRTIGFDIVVSNTGVGTAKGVTLTDTLPTTGGTNWSIALIDGVAPGANPPCSILNGILSCSFGNMASNTQHSVRITSPTTFASCSTIQNTVTALATNDGITAQTASVANNHVASASVTVQCPTVTVTKAADPVGPVSAGDQVGFVITVSNGGPGSATGVTVTDTLPTTSGTSWTIALIDNAAPGQNPPCAISNGVLTCNFGTMTPNTSHTVKVTSTTTSASCSTIQNSASVLVSNDGVTTPSVQNGHLASASVVVDCPALTVTKTANPAGPVAAGSTIGFDIQVSNAGPGVAKGVTLSDTLPTTTGTSWTIALIDNAAPGQNPPCAITNGVLGCSFGDMIANTSHSVRVTSSTTSDSCGTIRNSVVALATNDGITASTASVANGHLASASVTVNCPSLHVTKTANPPGPVTAGRTIGFDIVVSNTGAGTATGVTLSDTLPTTAGTSWTIALIDGAAPGANPPCAITNGVLACSFGDMASNTQHSVRITSPTTFESCSTVTNTVTALATNDGITSQTASVANNHVATASVVVNCPNLQVTKTANPAGPVSAGDPIGFDITVTNLGPGTALGVTLTDTLPTTTGTSWTIALIDNAAPGQNPPCSIANGVLGCSFGNMGPNTAHSIRMTSPTTGQSCSQVENSVTALATNDGVTASSATVENHHLANSSVVVNCPDLRVTKTANPAGPVNAGDPIGFDIVVSNLGPGTAKGVTLSDSLPTQSGTTWSIALIDGAAPPLVNPPCAITNGVLNCTFGDMATNTSHSVRVTSPTTSASCAVISNTVRAVATNDGITLNTASAANHHLATASVTVNCPDLRVTKTADASPVSATQQAGFGIGVTNLGPGVAKGVTINDPLPTTGGLTWTIDLIDGVAPGANPPCSINGSQVLSCAFGDMAANTSHSVHVITTTTVASCGTLTNIVTALATNDGITTQTATFANNHKAQAQIVVQCPDVNVTKTADAALIQPGQTAGFTITVRNLGPGTAFNVSLTDTLSSVNGLVWTIAGTTGTPLPTCNIVNNMLTCTRASLTANTSFSVHVTATTPRAIFCYAIPNTARVTAANEPSTATGNNQASASIFVNCGHPGTIGFWKNWRNHYTQAQIQTIIDYLVKNNTTVYSSLTVQKYDAIFSFPQKLSRDQMILAQLTGTKSDLAISDPCIQNQQITQKNDNIYLNGTLALTGIPGAVAYFDTNHDSIVTVGEVVAKVESGWTGTLQTSYTSTFSGFNGIPANQKSLVIQVLTSINEGTSLATSGTGPTGLC